MEEGYHLKDDCSLIFDSAIALYRIDSNYSILHDRNGINVSAFLQWSFVLMSIISFLLLGRKHAHIHKSLVKATTTGPLCLWVVL
jgi:hypothetical protein